MLQRVLHCVQQNSSLAGTYVGVAVRVAVCVAVCVTVRAAVASTSVWLYSCQSVNQSVCLPVYPSVLPSV